MVLIPGAGHLTQFEAPERFNAEVRAFIRSIADALPVEET
ncbi:MAG: alpha/beta fold hydrolase [Chloroflexota bacterium]